MADFNLAHFYEHWGSCRSECDKQAGLVVCQADRVQPQWPACGRPAVTGRRAGTVCLCMWLGPTSHLNYSPQVSEPSQPLTHRAAEKKKMQIKDGGMHVEMVAYRGWKVQGRRTDVKAIESFRLYWQRSSCPSVPPPASWPSAVCRTPLSNSPACKSATGRSAGRKQNRLTSHSVW